MSLVYAPRLSDLMPFVPEKESGVRQRSKGILCGVTVKLSMAKSHSILVVAYLRVLTACNPWSSNGRTVVQLLRESSVKSGSAIAIFDSHDSLMRTHVMLSSFSCEAP